MSNQMPTQQWISLVEYAARKDVSLSTLRRHIKANKIRYKKEKGKYLIFDETPNFSIHSSKEIDALRSDLQRAHREIAELKTLIAFYEEQLSNA